MKQKISMRSPKDRNLELKRFSFTLFLALYFAFAEIYQIISENPVIWNYFATGQVLRYLTGF